MPPPSVYITVSRSGLTCRPNGRISSPVLPMTVISAAGTAAFRPRRKRAAPIPPASTVIRMDASLAGSPRWGRPAAAGRLGSQLVPADFPVISGQEMGHYHVSLLTSGKTRACNFNHVVRVPSGAGRRHRAGPTGFTEGWRCTVAEVIVPLVHDAFGIEEDEAGELGWQDRALCAQTDPEAF